MFLAQNYIAACHLKVLALATRSFARVAAGRGELSASQRNDFTHSELDSLVETSPLMTAHCSRSNSVRFCRQIRAQTAATCTLCELYPRSVDGLHHVGCTTVQSEVRQPTSSNEQLTTLVAEYHFGGSQSRG